MADVYTYIVLKSFRFAVSGLMEDVVGEIRQQVRPEGSEYPFSWWISHHYRPSEGAATIYYPSRTSADSAEEAEMMLRAYAESFVADFGVKRSNEH